MPSPVGHSLLAVVINQSGIEKPSGSIIQSIVYAIILSNLADIDFLPGLLAGNPNRYHHGPTHSLGAAVIVGCIFGVDFFRKNGRFFPLFFYAILLYMSHILLDLLAFDSSVPYGEPVFWPVSKRYFISPFTPFSDIHKDSSSLTFFTSLFNSHNARTVLNEIIILSPILLIHQISKKDEIHQ